MINASSVPFSANNKLLSGSKTEFNLSKTESSAKEISSNKKKSPSFMALTNEPSLHSNNNDKFFFSISICSTSSLYSSGTVILLYWASKLSNVRLAVVAVAVSIPNLANNSSKWLNKLLWVSYLFLTGLCAPNKSPVSVFWWALTVTNFLPKNLATTWQTVVLPQPVSPTSNNGSLYLIDAETNTANLRIALVQTMEESLLNIASTSKLL